VGGRALGGRGEGRGEALRSQWRAPLPLGADETWEG